MTALVAAMAGAMVWAWALQIGLLAYGIGLARKSEKERRDGR